MHCVNSSRFWTIQCWLKTKTVAGVSLCLGNYQQPQWWQRSSRVHNVSDQTVIWWLMTKPSFSILVYHLPQWLWPVLSPDNIWVTSVAVWIKWIVINRYEHSLSFFENNMTQLNVCHWKHFRYGLYHLCPINNFFVVFISPNEQMRNPCFPSSHRGRCHCQAVSYATRDWYNVIADVYFCETCRWHILCWASELRIVVTPHGVKLSCWK